MSDVCDVAELIVARSIERQLLVDRQVALELAVRGVDVTVPAVSDVDAVLEAWLDPTEEPPAEVDHDRAVLLHALGVRR